MAVEFGGGLIARSLALVADAGHMLTDAAALAMAWAALRFATRPADQRRSFGYQRLQVLAAFLNGFTLLAVVAWIAFEAVQRLLVPEPVDAKLMLIIAAIGAAANVFIFSLLPHAHDADHGHGHGHGPERQVDINVAAARLHVLSDLLGSVAAIIAGAVILKTGWLPIDPILSLVVSALIVRNAWGLVRKSAHILMEGSPDWLDVGELRRQLQAKVPAILDIHHVHCWLLAPNQTLLTMHALIANSADPAGTLREANQFLAATYGINHATIQLEHSACAEVDCGPSNH